MSTRRLARKRWCLARSLRPFVVSLALTAPEGTGLNHINHLDELFRGWLGGVVDQAAGWAAKLVVEPDAGGEGE